MSKSIRSCLETYVAKHPTTGKESLLTRFDSVVSKGINEFQAARDIILDEHKSLYISLNGVKAKAGIGIIPYRRPGEADIATINESADDKKNKALAEIEKVHQEEMDKIEEKRKNKESQQQQKAKEKADKVKEIEQKKELAQKEATEKAEDKKEKGEPTKYQQAIKKLISEYGVNEVTAEKIYRVIRRIRNNDGRETEIKRILAEHRAATAIKKSKEQAKENPIAAAESGYPGGLQPVDTVVSATDEDIMAVEGWPTILAATTKWDGTPRKALNASANRTVGEALSEFKKTGVVEIKGKVTEMMQNKLGVELEGVEINNYTYLFDLLTHPEATDDQRGVAAALIAAHRLTEGNSWMTQVFKAAGKSVSIIYNDNVDSNAISIKSGVVSLNAYQIGRTIKEIGGEKRFFNWLEMALYEEVIHLATVKVAAIEEIEQVGRELTKREREMVESLYGAKLSDYLAGGEYIRQVMQHILFDTTTELVGANRHRKTLLAKILKFLKDIFVASKFPEEKFAKEIIKRLEDYLGITNPNDKFRTPAQRIAERPKMRLFANPDGQNPVMLFENKNRQYLMQKGTSGGAIFEVQKTPDGYFTPVDDGQVTPGLLGYSFAEAMSTLLGRGGRSMAASDQGKASDSTMAAPRFIPDDSPKFDINSVFSQELIDKAIRYAKDFTQGSNLERLPPAAEQGRRSSGPINAEATIITSAISRAAQAFRERVQQRIDIAVEQSFVAAREWLAEFNVNRSYPSRLITYIVSDKPGQLFNDDIEAALKLPNKNATLKRVVKYREEVQSLSNLIQSLPLKTKYAQEAALLQYAKENGHLIQDEDFSRPADSHGSESAIYAKPEGFVTKVMAPVFHKSWTELLDRIALYNFLFPATKLSIKGFYNIPSLQDDDIADNGNLRIVLQQPFVIRSTNSILSDEEIADDLFLKGFYPHLPDGWEDVAGSSIDIDKFINSDGVLLDDLTGSNNVMRDVQGNIQYIDPIVRYYDQVNELYLEEMGAPTPDNDELSEEEHRRLESEMAKDIIKEFGDESAINGDPIRDFEFPSDPDNVIVGDAMMTLIKRDENYQANVQPFQRSQYLMQQAQANMEALLGDLFANHEYDDVISYIISSIQDPTLDQKIKAELIKVTIQRLQYTDPSTADLIREKLYPKTATESSMGLLALRQENTGEGTSPGWVPKLLGGRGKKKKPKPYIDPVELFSHDKQSQEMARLLQSVEGGKEIVDQMLDLQNRMRSHLVSKEEEIILAMMADDVQERLDAALEKAKETKDTVAQMEKQIKKFSAEEKEIAKGKAGFLKYQMMARRNVNSMEVLVAKIKDDINKIAKEC